MFRLLFVGDNPPHAAPADNAAPAHSDVAVGFATSVDEALAQARACDMVFVSAALPDNRALEIVRAVAKAEPQVRILVKDLAESRQPALPYIEAGATGWLL